MLISEVARFGFRLTLVSFALVGISASVARSDGPKGALHDAPAAKGAALVVGESHGTAEAPGFTLALVDKLSRGGAVILGLELSPDTASLPCDSLAASLPASWQREHADGRTSAAMRELVCDAEKLTRRRKVTVLFLDDRSSGKPFDQNAAGKFVDALKANPNAAGVILTGNFHARNSPGSLTSNIRALGVQAVSVTQATTSESAVAWQCSGGTCGEKPVSLGFCKASGPSTPIEWMPSEDGRWDRCLSFPRLTASPPFADARSSNQR